MKRLRVNENISFKDLLCISLGVLIMVFGAVTHIDNNIIWSNTVFVWLERIVGLILIGVGITSR